jgi:hypothetical protein
LRNTANNKFKSGEEALTFPPPELEETDQRHPKFDRKYRDVDPSLLPKT